MEVMQVLWKQQQQRCMVVISCVFLSCNADHGLFLFSDTEFPYVFNKNLFVYYVHAVTFFW